jgi:hypothetical protein
MRNFEEIEELLYTDGEVRQQMEERRRSRFRANRPPRNSGVILTEQSSDYARMTTFPAGIERHFDSERYASHQTIGTALG